MKGAEEEKGAGDDPCMLATLRKLWFLGIPVLAGMLETGIFVPYLYSRVSCCSPGGESLPWKYDITGAARIDAHLNAINAAGFELPVPRGAERIPACKLPAFPNDHLFWSKSLHCTNPMYVQNTAQGIIAINAPVQKAVTLLVLPVGSAIADNVGRSPVLIVYVLMCVLACAIYAADSKLCHVWGNTMVIVAGAFICPCWEPKSSVINACVADLVGNSQKAKAQGMMVIFMCLAAGSLIGFVLAYVCLMHHPGSYFHLWIIYTGMALGFLVFTLLAVPETLPKGVEADNFRAYEIVKVFKAQCETFRMMCRDRLLVCLIVDYIFCWGHFVGFITQAYTYKIHIGLSQQESIAPSICNTSVQVIFSLFLGKFANGIKSMNLFLAGQFFMMCSYIAMGPLMHVFGHAAPYVGYSCFGLAFALMCPAASTTISDRVAPEHQARAQAAVCWTTAIGTVIAPVIWNLVLFDATAHGFRFLLPVYVSMILSVLCVFMAMLMAWKCDAWPSAKDLCRDECTLPLLAAGSSARPYKAA